MKEDEFYNVPSDFKIPEDQIIIPIKTNAEIFEDFIQKVSRMRSAETPGDFCSSFELSSLAREQLTKSIPQNDEECKKHLRNLSLVSGRPREGKRSFYLGIGGNKQEAEYVKVIKEVLDRDGPLDRCELLSKLDGAIMSEMAGDFCKCCVCGK